MDGAGDAALIAMAVRHKCVGYLLAGCERFGVPGSNGSLVERLKAQCAAACVPARDIRAQLSALVHVLVEHDVKFALLNGAARLYGGDPSMRVDALQDFYILVPRAELDVAREALFRGGYQWDFGASDVALFERLHHHLAPLRLPSGGAVVEIHWALAPPKALTIQTQWGDLRESLETIHGEGGPAQRLDRFGAALHLLVAGIEAERFEDYLIVARYLHDDPSLFVRLSAAIAGELRRPVALAGGLVIAARIAGIAVSADRRVREYVDWVFRREELSERQRMRAQFVDAWYANGGSLFHAATHAMLPKVVYGERRWQQRGLRPIRLAGHLGGGGVGNASSRTRNGRG